MIANFGPGISVLVSLLNNRALNVSILKLEQCNYNGTVKVKL